MRRPTRKAALIAVVALIALWVGSLARDQYYQWAFSTKRLAGQTADEVIAKFGKPFSDSRRPPWNEGSEFQLYYRDGSGGPWEIYFDSAGRVREVRPGPWKARR